MTPNEYRLNGMAHWCRYGQSMRWDGEALRIAYIGNPIPVPLPGEIDDTSFYYRLNAEKRFITEDGREYWINEIEMQLQDGSWEVIERVINAR